MESSTSTMVNCCLPGMGMARSLAVVLLIVVCACSKGVAGPQGPPGPQGAQTQCSLRAAADATTRCLPIAPTGWGGFFLDAACTKPMQTAVTACPPSYATAGVDFANGSVCSNAQTFGERILAFGAMVIPRIRGLDMTSSPICLLGARLHPLHVHACTTERSLGVRILQHRGSS